MHPFVLLIFIIVYLSMILGYLPGLALDRTGVALLGAIALLAGGRVSIGDLEPAIDEPTVALLFGLMVISAQFRLSGFYSHLVRKVTGSKMLPSTLLFLVILLSGVLSSLLANDVVCLAVTPILIETCAQRRLNPLPFLIALACASNVGSMATIIGNPQNMLIGQVLHLSFWKYSWAAMAPSILGLVVVWVVIVSSFKNKWNDDIPKPTVIAPAFNLWQTSKGAVILLALVLFLSLFVINYAMMTSGTQQVLIEKLTTFGIDPERPSWLFILAVILSNLVSNVPSVMLLLPPAVHPSAGEILAMASTLSGNLFIVGSIANIIVVEQASLHGVKITWRDHARIGVPVTLITLTIAWLWLWWLYI